MSTATGDRKVLGVRLLTPEGIVFDDQATMVVAPGVAGEVGLLARHEPLVAALRFGETRIHVSEGETRTFATSEGYLSIGEDRVFILVEQAEELGQIDVARAENALRRAQENLEGAGDDEAARDVYQAALRRAENRLKVAQKSR